MYAELEPGVEPIAQRLRGDAEDAPLDPSSAGREGDAVLVDHDRLDGWINYAYRALKADRDDRPLERRLDAAESMPWILDVVFALAGRVRPYHKYLPWEVREHPLPDRPPDVLLPLLEGTLDGDPAAIRETFARVKAGCAAYDAARGHDRAREIIHGWGDELVFLWDGPESRSQRRGTSAHGSSRKAEVGRVPT